MNPREFQLDSSTPLYEELHLNLQWRFQGETNPKVKYPQKQCSGGPRTILRPLLIVI